MPRPPAPAFAADFVTSKLAAQGISTHQVDPDYLGHLQHLHPDGDSSADFVAAKLAAQGIRTHQVDPDYLSHLQHLHPDGDSSADFVAAKLAAQGISTHQVDPDYLSHLQDLEHLHPGGDSSVLEPPARGRPDSPPLAIKREQPDDGEARSAPFPSPAPEGGDRQVEEKKPPVEIPGDETADMDESYRTFWEHKRVVNGRMVVEIDGEVIPYDQVDKADGAEKKDGDEAAARAAPGENGGGVRKEKRKRKRKVGRPALKPRVRDSPAHRQKKEKKGGKNGGKKVKVEEEEEDQGAGVKNRAKKTKSRVRNSPAHCQKSHGEKDGGKTDAEIKVEEEEEKMAVISTGRPALRARVRGSPAAHWQKKERKGGGNGAKKIELEEEEERSLRKLPVETLNTVNREPNSSDGNDAEPHIASGLDTVVWPIHIMERPDSEFKERLMRVLRKPFSQGEYDRLLAHATVRLPATKKRQTRSGVKYYDSAHERIQSYFDSHPDLAKQVRSTSEPNQLALLRGFFFWLKNITNEDQFRPWRDDFRHYKLISSME